MNIPTDVFKYRLAQPMNEGCWFTTRNNKALLILNVNIFNLLIGVEGRRLPAEREGLLHPLTKIFIKANSEKDNRISRRG
ncbi:hypothetical protein A9C19_12770 [Bacillus weihaiensis]|uniref:Uncharacterized protein n=1 Tax=Bacillus weihaiensis TaxID=1547283 RepID=A0A1L3MTC9_9BACI|nr:hypothetical protein A9C19_12770 [Bacillus weihaiensis]